MKPKEQAEINTQKVRDTIMQKTDVVPIEVTARLCSASMALKDVMDLQTGDVLLLEQKTGEPLTLLFNDRAGFKGYPVQSSGKYAILLAPTKK